MYKYIGGNEIYGLRTVNCGEIYEFDICDPVNPMRQLRLEVLRPEKHNPHAQIICMYIWDVSKLNKIELTLYKLEDGTYGSEIYYFKNKDTAQHYRSSNYPNFQKLPKKYMQYMGYLKPCFTAIFNN